MTYKEQARRMAEEAVPMENGVAHYVYERKGYATAKEEDLELLDRLGKYANHRPLCMRMVTRGHACSCGLDALLTEVRTALGTDNSNTKEG